MSRSYSYKPMRLGTGKMGKITHRGASNHLIKQYTGDQVIAKRHLAALKKARTSAATATKGRVELYGQMLPRDGASFVHEVQSNFHHDRSSIVLDQARVHHTRRKMYSQESDIDDKINARMPSMYDYLNDDDHSVEEAMTFHKNLHADCLNEAVEYMRMAEQAKTALDVEQDPANMRMLEESLDVLREMHSYSQTLADCHEYYGSLYREYLNSKANDLWGRPQRDEPADLVHEPASSMSPGPSPAQLGM
jgi:hypothetical protein